MHRPDYSTPRIFIDAPLSAGQSAALDAAQMNYLINVLRLREDARVLVFNGFDGEFAGELALKGRKSAMLRALAQTRPQNRGPDIDYLFAPLKHARLDYIAQKAVEMGANSLRPVLTRRTQAARLNLDRLRANVIEAAEQCGVIALPSVHAAAPLAQTLAQWPRDRLMVFCDEDAPTSDPLEALAGAQFSAGAGVLIGPEGGFEESERRDILSLPNRLQLSLGPRILRADTAGVAALALVQAALGDWRGRTR